MYTRAFYKKYAEFLELEPEESLSVYQQSPQRQGKTGGRYNFSAVVTLKGREGNMFAGIAQKMFVAVIIVFGGFLLYWIYKNYLAPYNPFDFF